MSDDGHDTSPRAGGLAFPGPDVDEVPAASRAGGAPRFIRVEANLLRLPLFALHTRGLRSLDGIECSGRVNRSGQAYRFTFRATRNTATAYPGPLARAAHLAFLSLLTEGGVPSAHPFTWTWRELCRRMGVTCGGQMVRHLRQAITATAGLLLHSEYALYAKPEGKLIQTATEALHLYERVAFIGSPLPEGGTADTNYLWLSDWYRANLDALFSAPLDYGLWRHLDARSPLASRLYEFLLLNFHGPAPVLRINYDTLVRFLPARAERYRSLAQRQLGPALELLAAAGVLGRADWSQGKGGLTQLHLYRGSRLNGRATAVPAVPLLGEEEIVGPVAVKELRNVRPPEWGLVADFYRLWTGQERRPTAKELAQARDLVAAHGPARAKGLIPLVVKRLRVEWPQAKTFGAIAAYLPDALRDQGREHRLQELVREEQRQERHERKKQEQERARREQLRQQWQPVWEELPDSEREDIEAAVRGCWPQLFRGGLAQKAGVQQQLERLCWEELARRRADRIE